MESRFSKYKEENTATNGIANINKFIDNLFDKGLNIIEKEINDLQARINGGIKQPIFENKIKLLIKLGEDIEQLYETYHFNKGN